MKDKIIKFIKDVVTVFANRLKDMPAAKPQHQIPLALIAEDAKKLEDAQMFIEELDEAQPKAFVASALFYLLEKVAPIFRSWSGRIKLIGPGTHVDDVQGHIKAFKQFNELKVEIYTLIDKLNGEGDAQLIPITEGVEIRGKEIIRCYDKEVGKEKFLATHPIQPLVEESVTMKKLLLKPQ
jgi:hypothetical protein